MTDIPSSMQSEFSAGGPIFDRPSRGRRASRAFVRYLIAICIGVAATLAWQSYGEATKQIIAVRAPQLGWSPEVQQKIASWIQQLGWTKPPASPDTALRPTTPEAAHEAPVAQLAPEMVAPKAPAGPSLEVEQVQRMTEGLVALRQTVEQLATRQDQMARDIAKLQAADQEILDKVSAPPPQPAAIPARKHTPVSPPASRAPIPLH